MGKNLVEQCNEQFNFEVESGYIYLAMAAYCEDKGMEGFAHFMKKQAEEEFEHAEKFYNFIFEMDGKPEYTGMEKPKAEYGSFKEVFQTALDHEKEVTKRIKTIYKNAKDEDCFDTQQFLNWFIEEQREEEDTFRNIVERLDRINEAWNGLYIYDRELGQR